jgi:bromodomain-containing factor 1
MCKRIKGFRSKVEATLKKETQATALPAPSNPVASAMNRSQKPKKNKPMGKGEQERKLEQLAKLKTQYQQKGRQSSGSQEPPPSHEATSAAAEPAQAGDDSDVSSEED